MQRSTSKYGAILGVQEAMLSMMSIGHITLEVDPKPETSAIPASKQGKIAVGRPW